MSERPIPVAAWSKAWVYGRSHAVIEGSNPAGDMDVFLLWVRSLVQRIPTERGVSKGGEYTSLLYVLLANEFSCQLVSEHRVN